MIPLQSILAIGPLGTPEIIVISLLVLVLFGSKKLPGFARSLGKSMGEFKRAREDFEKELHRAADDVEDKDAIAARSSSSSSQGSYSQAPARNDGAEKPRIPASIEA